MRRDRAVWGVLTSISRLAALLPAFLFRIAWRLLDHFDGRMGSIARYVLIAGRLKSCGSRVYFGPFVTITCPKMLSVGSRVSIHCGCTLISDGGISIGNDVSIAHSSSLVSTSHTWSDPVVAIKYGPIVARPIEIFSDVWVGCGSRIVGGVAIKSRCIIAAGAVVTRACESGNIYAGVPARSIKRVDG